MNLQNFLLASETIGERLSKWNVITGLVLAVIGLAFMIAAKPAVNKIFKDKTDEQKTTYILRLKMVSAIFAFAGLILAVIV